MIQVKKHDNIRGRSLSKSSTSLNPTKQNEYELKLSNKESILKDKKL